MVIAFRSVVISVFKWPLKFLVLSCFLGETLVEAVSVDEIVSGVKVEAKSPGAAGVPTAFAVVDSEGTFALAWVAAIVASLFDVLMEVAVEAPAVDVVDWEFSTPR